MSNVLVRTTVRLPKGLLTDAKIRAVETGTTFQDLVIEALQQYLKKGGRK